MASVRGKALRGNWLKKSRERRSFRCLPLTMWENLSFVGRSFIFGEFWNSIVRIFCQRGSRDPRVSEMEEISGSDDEEKRKERKRKEGVRFAPGRCPRRPCYYLYIYIYILYSGRWDFRPFATRSRLLYNLLKSNSSPNPRFSRAIEVYLLLRSNDYDNGETSWDPAARHDRGSYVFYIHTILY